MKQIGSLFSDAVSRAEASHARSVQGDPRKVRKKAGHQVTKLAEVRSKQRKNEARSFAQQARKMGLDPETLSKIDAAAKAHSTRSEQWIFVMLSPSQNANVVRWINSNSKRPHKAVELWATLLEHLRMDTGEIMATRQELAERVGMKPNDLSKTMSELASINAIRREKTGRSVRYFLNPSIATHLPSASAREAARDGAGPLLKLMEGGKE